MITCDMTVLFISAEDEGHKTGGYFVVSDFFTSITVSIHFSVIYSKKYMIKDSSKITENCQNELILGSF